MNTLQVWANTTMSVCQTFMGMIAGLFTAVLAINIFKDTNEEGTELIVISKPISRTKLVLSKFALFGFYCLMVNISAVIISLFTIFLPTAEPKFYVGLVVSMFIGNAVTFAVFGAISILLTLKFAKVGIIVVNVLVSLVFLIYQVLTLFVFSTPLVELNNNNMAATSYITHNRNFETGEYTEDHFVKFVATPLENGDPHPCQAKNWKGIVDFWENDIKSKDPTPILNLTDVASQIALTYMSYKTNEFSQRQSDRLFGFSRFYDYKLTSPASPEIISDDPNHKSLPLIYTGYNWRYIDEDLDLIFYMPEALGYDGIGATSSTSLRGYGDLIPIGHIKSKEFVWSRAVYFEKEQWVKYSDVFNEIYNDVYEYKHYEMPEWEHGDDYMEAVWAFKSSQKNWSKHYDLIWQHLMNNKAILDINSVLDLNERYLQYKNWVFWKLVQDQHKLLVDGIKPASKYDYLEQQARFLYQRIEPTMDYLLQVEKVGNGWMKKCIDDVDDGFLVENTMAPDFNALANIYALETQLEDYQALSQDEKIEACATCSWAYYLKTSHIFHDSANQDENYLYDSLEKSTRSSKYNCSIYTTTTGWVPNTNSQLAKLFDVNINFPAGHNLMLFYYKTIPTLTYWVFAVIWGTISLAAYAAGILLYKKFDIK